MSDSQNDEMNQFLVTGAKTYLDVSEAMAEFSRLVQRECRAVVTKRLRDLNAVCHMGWNMAAFRDFSHKWEGRVWIGEVVELKQFGGLYFCMEMSREVMEPRTRVGVYLYRERKELGTGLWDRLSEMTSPTLYIDGDNLVFARCLSDNQIPGFASHLDDTVTDFIGFISGAGNFPQHLKAT